MMKPATRRTTCKRIVATLVSFAATVAIGTAQAADPVKVRPGDLAQAVNAIASNEMIQQGFDKKHGIAIEYSTYPTLDGLFTAIGGKQVNADYATTWTDDTVRSLSKFAKLANEVMGGGFLGDVPAAAFTTKFVPR